MNSLNMESILRAMMLAGASLPAFQALLEEVKKVFNEKDQEVLQEAYENIRAENTEGHDRFQELLKEAEGR